ncbi:coiled-coil alpha-helical rod protein 1 isoform X11 [Heterocephalus glaber]|uniref:Coiled-coil alpha-helical rod protein 1 n=1 Tax=Heterocephalus glaber TaxID=10181 RepID=A0AAX6T0R0_HETGA|nr:coiled-coil alpha-helical rod protein 1 isoform X11 [Heterocephalus glaber]
MLPPSGLSGLVPPSHFQARPFPAQSRAAPPWVSDIPPSQPRAHQDVSERHQRPPVTAWEQGVSGAGHGPCRRGRSLELAGSQALSEQAELISRQLQELRRLEEEVRGLRETSLKQKMRLEAQAVELEALARAEKASQVEAEGLRAALAGAEVVRKNLEEGTQRELEEVQRLHQEQLSSLMQAHQEALASLTSKTEGLEKSLRSLEARRAGEAKELAEALNEAELLRKQLSKTQEDLEAQVVLVENLRKYVGEQVPPEAGSQAWEPERQELLDTVQRLQEDRAGLHTTAELLQVRVQSLVCVLALQEEELTRKKLALLLKQDREVPKAGGISSSALPRAHTSCPQLPPSDSLEPECVRKHQSLLSRWREKVFALLVQLRSQELEHRDSVKALQGQVAELQEQLIAQSQERAILQRSLQDRAAEVEVERMGTQVLQQELSRAQEARQRQQQQTARAEEQLKLVAGAVCSCQIALQSTTAKLEQAVARLPSLGNRLSYAVRKVHTIQGLMARKLALAELHLESCPPLAPPADTEEVGRAREQALQEKVAEVETGLREQLSDAERRLNEARREQAKAVVSLRQTQRKAAGEKERNQELRRLQEEARKEEGQRLSRRLQELERDKNLMLVTLQQEGLLSHYKQQRLLAVLPSLLDEGRPAESSSRPPGSAAPVLPAAAPSTRKSGRGSLSLLLDSLQGLSEAIAEEEAVCQGDSQRCPAPVHG